MHSRGTRVFDVSASNSPSADEKWTNDDAVNNDALRDDAIDGPKTNADDPLLLVLLLFLTTMMLTLSTHIDTTAMVTFKKISAKYCNNTLRAQSHATTNGIIKKALVAGP